MLQDEDSVQDQSPSQYLLSGYHSSDTEEEICVTQPRTTGSEPRRTTGNKQLHVDSPLICETVVNNIEPRRTTGNKQLHVDSPLICETVVNNICGTVVNKLAKHDETFARMEIVTNSNLKSTN